MRATSPDDALARTWEYCSSRQWVGMDPYDGLMARRWPITLLSRSRVGRLVLIQGVKHSPLNLRPLIGVPELRNAKALALGLDAACRLALVSSWRDRARAEAAYLVGELLSLSTQTRHGHGWGYPFDWQSRVFFLRAGVPTVVCTAFVVRALAAAHRLFSDEPALADRIADAMRAAVRFVLHDLQRTEDGAGFCWSYSPLDRTQVVNATLLGAEAVARVAMLDGDRALFDQARPTLSWSAARRTSEGGWLYGADSSQLWEDSFHTGFILLSYLVIRDCAASLGVDPDEVVDGETLDASYAYYRETFFDASGRPWYRKQSPFPVDSHAAAVAILTLLAFRERAETARSQAGAVLDWTLEHLWLEPGYFRFQIKRYYRIDIAYLRWSQAWMLRALSEWKLTEP